MLISSLHMLSLSSSENNAEKESKKLMCVCPPLTMQFLCHASLWAGEVQ